MLLGSQDVMPPGLDISAQHKDDIELIGRWEVD